MAGGDGERIGELGDSCLAARVAAAASRCFQYILAETCGASSCLIKMTSTSGPNRTCRLRRASDSARISSMQLLSKSASPALIRRSTYDRFPPNSVCAFSENCGPLTEYERKNSMSWCMSTRDPFTILTSVSRPFNNCTSAWLSSAMSWHRNLANRPARHRLLGSPVEHVSLCLDSEPPPAAASDGTGLFSDLLPPTDAEMARFRTRRIFFSSDNVLGLDPASVPGLAAAAIGRDNRLKCFLISSASFSSFLPSPPSPPLPPRDRDRDRLRLLLRVFLFPSLLGTASIPILPDFSARLNPPPLPSDC